MPIAEASSLPHRADEFGQRRNESRYGANQQSDFQNGHGFLLVVRRP